MKEENYSTEMASVMHSLQVSLKKICISTTEELLIVVVSDIIRCESIRNYTQVFLKDKSTLVATKTLGDFEELLTPYDFYRSHNSHLINLAHVKSYKKTNGGYILLQDDTPIPVSTRRREKLMHKLKSI